MAKFALLIGISEYYSDLCSLPAAVKDVEALKLVLERPDIGNFKTTSIINGDTQAISRAIEEHFLQCGKNDLALLFFSGHGIKDELGNLYLASKETSKYPNGNLRHSTAIKASFIQEQMDRSRSRRKVVILDCCFSGAFGEGFLAKDDGLIDIRSQLGGEGIAVLTSSTSLQYSFENKESETSVYTRYLVEGIETGAADVDGDGKISSQDLHKYAAQRVSEATPAMKPQFFPFKDGLNIYLAQALSKDPILQYRREVERIVGLSSEPEEISNISRRALDRLQKKIGIPESVANRILYEVLEPYREKSKNLQEYEKTLDSILKEEHPLSKQSESKLRNFQIVLELKDEDVAPIRTRLLSEREALEEREKQSPQNVLDDNINQHRELRLFTSTTIFIALVVVSILGGLGISTYYLWKNEMSKEEILEQPFQAISFSSGFGEVINSLEARVKANREGLRIGNNAWIMYTENGDINGALEELKKVSPMSSEYDLAQEQIEKWPEDFARNERNLQLSRTSLMDGDLASAERYANELDETQKFWRERQQKMLGEITQERARIARETHRRICTRNQEVSLVQFAMNEQGDLELSESGDLIEEKRYLLTEGTRVMLVQSSSSSQVQDQVLDQTDNLSLVEVKDGLHIDKEGWVDSRFLCSLEN